MCVTVRIFKVTSLGRRKWSQLAKWSNRSIPSKIAPFGCDEFVAWKINAAINK